ncbi:protransforming growth factor alpha isoform X2 [Xenopus laevis]|uniref:Protransforming growth factor alpha isoform X2 n=1 Tax=Xenopus laevis TaxID=8355 RepID=A0A8J0TA34_XENLA|nr:protransforming growth factor alpha isoform X2 [Xenopus laevis]XP_018080993.1 protransforming growth factor alpha isoform X2 [Xenopus laevis]XP_041424832.1 protransforming growth factor alpha isoform X2 [Xenopus laevis]
MLDMYGALAFLLAATFMPKSSSQSMFAECPDKYTNFCYYGTCRFLISEWEASCICFKGYIGSRCQYVDLLQVMALDPRSFTVAAIAVTLLVALSLIGSTYLGVYLCRVKRERSRLSLLKNMESQEV